MKIIHLTDLFSPSIGGMETYILNLVRERHRRGHDVSVITMSLVGPAGSSVEDTGYVVHRIGAGYTRMKWAWSNPEHLVHPPFPDPVIALKIQEIIRREKPDAVQAHNWMALSYLSVKDETSPPLLWMQHDYSLACPKKTASYYKGDGICPNPSLEHCIPCSVDQYGITKGTAITIAQRSSNRTILSRVDKLLANSVQVATFDQQVVESGNAIEVVGTLISDNLEEESLSIPRPDYLPPNDDYLLFVGALSSHKGLPDLLAAYELLGSEAPPLVIFGTPQPHQNFVWPSGAIVRYNVPHDEVMAAWRHCRIGVVPSRWAEPVGLVALEAGAMGRPIIASRTGGLAEIVIDGVTGLLFEPGNPADLAAKIKLLHADLDRCNRLGEAGKEQSRSYSATQVTDRLDKIVEDLVAAKKLRT